jgi:hypothetical protein
MLLPPTWEVSDTLQVSDTFLFSLQLQRSLVFFFLAGVLRGFEGDVGTGKVNV